MLGWNAIRLLVRIKETRLIPGLMGMGQVEHNLHYGLEETTAPSSGRYLLQQTRLLCRGRGRMGENRHGPVLCPKPTVLFLEIRMALERTPT